VLSRAAAFLASVLGFSKRSLEAAAPEGRATGSRVREKTPGRRNYLNAIHERGEFYFGKLSA